MRSSKPEPNLNPPVDWMTGPPYDRETVDAALKRTHAVEVAYDPTGRATHPDCADILAWEVERLRAALKCANAEVSGSESAAPTVRGE